MQKVRNNGEATMGRKSTKEDKNVYQLRREALGLSRERAAELLGSISEDRLARIELQPRAPHPDEVVVMAEGYRDPSLCNHYCANSCPIGKSHAVEVTIRDLPTIVLQTVASINAVEKHKDRFIEIAADCRIDETEIRDFKDIQEALGKISMAVEALRLWAEQMEVEGEQQG